MKIHPIHYAMLLAVMALLGGIALAAYTAQPLVFVVALLVVYLVGSDNVGRFGAPDQGDSEDGGDYQGSEMGFGGSLAKRVQPSREET